MSDYQSPFSQIPPEVTDCILHRLPLESLRDVRLCARSIGPVPVHGLIKSLHIPLGELDICDQQSSRPDRLRAMTGLTHLQLIGLKKPESPRDPLQLWGRRSTSVPDTDDAFDSTSKPEELLEIHLLMSDHVRHLPLLTSLEMKHVGRSSAASVAAYLQ